MKLINYILLLLCLNACSGQPEQSGYTEMKTPVSAKKAPDERALRKNMNLGKKGDWEHTFLTKWEHHSVPLGEVVGLPVQGVKRINVYI